MKLYSLYDSKAGVFLPPFCAGNAELAKRLVAASLLNAKDLPPAEYPGDYNLFEVAEFDEEDGVRPLPDGQWNVGNVLAILSDFRRRMARAKAEADELAKVGEEDKKKPLENEYDAEHV